MEYRFLVSDNCQLEKFQKLLRSIEPKIEQFICFLQNEYAVVELPRTVILSDHKTATQLISDIPIPAYTNDLRTVFCPEMDVWREIYLQQLADTEHTPIRSYYERELSENSVLQILGHEFVHHSELFWESAYEKGIWFEEGMCEYISRKYFLTELEFEREVWANSLLVEHFEAAHGLVSLESFGSETYRQDIAAMFCCYWKSFLAVRTLADRYDGDILSVFREYHRWAKEEPNQTLTQWFHLET